jgi:hypothetical protein
LWAAGWAADIGDVRWVVAKEAADALVAGREAVGGAVGDCLGAAGEGAVGWVGPGRPAGIAPGGFPRPARRTRRACLHATGAPRVLPAGQLDAAGVQGVVMVLPR